MPKPPRPPVGVLLDEARRRSRKSAIKAAREAGISDTRWRHIVNGYQPAGPGQFIPVTAPAETLARMAHAVSVLPDDLRASGRSDAAEALDNLRASMSRPTAPPEGAVRLAIEEDTGLWPEARAALLALYDTFVGRQVPLSDAEEQEQKIQLAEDTAEVEAIIKGKLPTPKPATRGRKG